MHVNSDWTIALLTTLVKLWLCILGPTIVQSTLLPCEMNGLQCVYDKLDFSSDGLQRLRSTSRDLSQFFQISVDLLISPYPDGVFLQLISEFVQEVLYQQYKDRIFRIPPNALLTGIILAKAPQLSSVTVVAPNRRLTSLEIRQSNLRTIPSAFTNLYKLSTLNLANGELQSFSLDPIANCREISILICSNNKITKLIASRNASLVIPLVDLLLSDNLLESIDGAFFQPLQKLLYIDLGYNRIQRLDGQPLSLPRVKYFLLSNNQLQELDMTGWNVPFLMELSLQNNNLTRIPIGIEKHPNLTTLLLANNLLSVVDLRRLEGWDILQTIDLAGNRIRNVMITGSGRLTLPGLKRVDLSNNQLARLEFVRWDFPKLSSMALAFNRFQRFPNLWKMFPELGNVIAFQNPLLCEAVRNLQQLISTMRLIVDASGFGRPCTTNATFTLQSGRVICCVE